MFTLNNPHSAPVSIPINGLLEFAASLVDAGARYVCFGREVGSECGTMHLQGFMCFHNQRALSGVRKLIPTAHWEQMRGTQEQAIAYTKKDGDWWEYGERPMTKKEKGDASREIFKKVISLAEQNDFQAIKDMEPGIYLQHYSTLHRIQADCLAKVEDLSKPCGIWIHGPSGAGKSHVVRHLGPTVYDKLFNKWWCGYSGQEIALLDDADPRNTQHLENHLKRWTDQYSFTAEIKGGTRCIRPPFVIITSQYSIEHCFDDENTRSALSRRCRTICISSGSDSDRAALRGELRSLLGLDSPPPSPRCSGSGLGCEPSLGDALSLSQVCDALSSDEA